MPPQAPSGGLTIRDYLGQEAEKLQIPKDLAFAIVDTESGGTHQADKGLTTSRTGAQGFFQLMPDTAKELGVDPSDPFQNISGGLKYFKQQLDAHGGDVRLALAAYNAGPGRTAEGKVPEIPETQEYVQRVLSAWQGGAPTKAAAAPAARQKVATPPPTGASAGMMPPSPALAEKQVPDQSLFESAIVAPAVGFGKQALTSVGDIGRTVERVTGLNLPDLPQGDLAQRTAGEKLGGFAEQAAEFAIPSAGVTKARKGLQITQKLVQMGVTPARARLVAAAAEGAGQAAVSAGVSEVHGDDPKTAAAIAAASPIVGTMVTQMAPLIRQAAITRMARFMERGTKGDITPELTRSLAQAASDFVDLPLKRTWRQTSAMTRGLREKAGQNLESALQGPLGDVLVAKKPVVDALGDLALHSAQHLAPVQGGIRTVTYRPELVKAVEDLQEVLSDYGDMIPARQLHDLKQTWWRAVYPRRESANPIASLGELLTTAQKEARTRGAGAIMDVLKQTTPKISDLDSAVSHAAKLDQFVKRLAVKSRTGTLAKPAAKYTVGALGGAAGVGAGGLVGHPIIGAHIGYATARMLMNAVESPKWRLLPIATRRSLANALASGQGETARKILTPIALAATADQDDLLSDSASASR